MDKLRGKPVLTHVRELLQQQKKFKEAHEENTLLRIRVNDLLEGIERYKKANDKYNKIKAFVLTHEEFKIANLKEIIFND